MSVSFNPSFSTDDVCVGQDTSLCLTDDLTSIKTSLAGKISEDDAVTSFAAINHTHSGYAASDHTHSDYADVDHTHTIANVTGLQNAPDGKASSSHTHTGYAASGHTHTGYAPSNHSHTPHLSEQQKKIILTH